MGEVADRYGCNTTTDSRVGMRGLGVARALSAAWMRRSDALAAGMHYTNHISQVFFLNV